MLTMFFYQKNWEICSICANNISFSVQQIWLYSFNDFLWPWQVFFASELSSYSGILTNICNSFLTENRRRRTSCGRATSPSQSWRPPAATVTSTLSTSLGQWSFSCFEITLFPLQWIFFSTNPKPSWTEPGDVRKKIKVHELHTVNTCHTHIQNKIQTNIIQNTLKLHQKPSAPSVMAL